ncbi:MAG: hypothetical protein EAZ94_08265 [Oscillatoriales cyanobacterium]|nr:MAG: hypothetical protein EAZ94_08265 [Oscillatoriales cyanobacterium]TAE25672.1 MAG: hypothetical protein EAZ93_10020 [Oscillatoriales cyanobacterium]
MYTLEQLQQRTFKELKEIGWQLNVLPAGDRRCRQNWIDAIAGVQPPLLKLLEVSPGVEVEPVAEAIEIQAQEPPIKFKFKFGRIISKPTTKPIKDGRITRYLCRLKPIAQTVDSPGVEIEPVAEAIEVQATEPIELALNQKLELVAKESEESAAKQEPTQKAHKHRFLLSLKDGDNTLWYDGKDFVLELWRAKTYCKRGVGPAKCQLRHHPEVKRVFNSFGTRLQVTENSPGVSFDIEEFQQAHVAEIDAYVASFTDDRPPNRGSGDRGRIEPKVTQSALKQTGKKSIAHQLLELFKASALIIPDSPAAESEPKVTQSALKQTETSPSSEAIPVGIALSDRFLARYAPPQPEQIHFKVDADGQLSLLDFELSGIEEPPDPDDYDCMFSFWAAYDAWCDRFGDESFEQCTELDSQCTELDSQCTELDSQCTELDSQCTELDSQCTEPIQIELASMVEWAPCLDEYEPETIETIETSSITLEISSMLILSEGCANESFDTCDFSIPTFDVWCDRPIDTDEPPDTGIFARRPLPKPPSFPPMAVVAGDQANRIKKFARSATFLSERAPPGGDASF